MPRKYKGVQPTECGNKIKFDIRINGERIRPVKAIKPTKAGLEQAEKIWYAIQHDIDNDNLDISKYFPRSKIAQRLNKNNGNHITIGELLDRYLRHSKSELAYSTWQNYKTSILNILIPEFGDIPASKLKRSHIQDWKTKYHTSDKPIVNKTLHNILCPLYNVMDEALDNEIIDKNIFNLWRPKITKELKEDEDINPFTLDEINKILNTCTGQVRNLLQFAFWSGLRTSELIALKWSDIDFDEKLIKVRRKIVNGVEGPPKTVSGKRDIQILDNAMQALISQKEFTYKQNDRVFHHPKNMCPWKTDKQIRESYWKPILKAADVEYRKAYQTRHTYASILLTAGVDPSYVAKLMGHADWSSIRKHYARWIRGVDNQLEGKIDAFLLQHSHKER